MRPFLAAVLSVAAVCAASAADKNDLSNRHGIAADLKAYPQGTPKEALASVVKAVEDKKADYFTAQLADPEFVDRRLKATMVSFEKFVEDEVKPKLITDPAPLKQFQKFLKDGEWEVQDGRAVVRLKDVPDRVLYLRQVEGRWFLENRYQPEEKK